MITYIQNIIPRIRQFSADLNKKETYVEIPWIHIDSEGRTVKYIFKRNGELIISLDGMVTIGKWEYLSVAKNLLVDMVTSKILLQQDYVDGAIMVLRHDNVTAGSFILANEIMIKNFAIAEYL